MEVVYLFLGVSLHCVHTKLCRTTYFHSLFMQKSIVAAILSYDVCRLSRRHFLVCRTIKFRGTATERMFHLLHLRSICAPSRTSINEPLRERARARERGREREREKERGLDRERGGARESGSERERCGCINLHIQLKLIKSQLFLFLSFGTHLNDHFLNPLR